MDPKTPDQKVRPGSANAGAGDDIDTDDFLDEDLEDLEEGSWEEDGERAEEAGFEEPVRRKKAGFFSFNTIIIILAVVFGGGFVLTQMAKRGSSIQSAEIVAPVSRLQMSGMQDNPVFKDVRKEPQRLPQGDGSPGVAVLPSPSTETEKEGPAPSSSGALENDRVPLPEKAEGGSGGTAVAQTQVLPREPVSDVLTPLPSLETGTTTQPPLSSTEEALSGGADPLAPFRKKPAVAQRAPEAQDVPSVASPAKDLSLDRSTAVPAVPVQQVDKTDLSAPALEEANSLTDLPPIQESLTRSSVGKESGNPDLASKSIPRDASLADRSDLPGKDVEALRKALSEFENRLSGLESRLDDLSKESQSSASPPVSQSPDIQDLKASIAQLQKEVADSLRDQRTGVSTARKSERPKDLTEQDNKVGSRISTQKARSSSPASRSGSARESRQGESSSRWEIRAIQPGVAWVAPPGGGDMQTVEVGDSLAGLGTIRKISVVNGIWTIEGTKGRLQQ